MLARGRCTNGASRKDLWRDASLYLRRWCVKSASQAVVREMAKSLVEYDEERALILLKNPPFTDQVYQGKYKTFVGAPPSHSRDRVRPIHGLNDVMSDLLENQLLKHHVDPLMTRAQQVETILRLDAESETRNNQDDISVVFEEDLCSISKEDTARIDTEDNSYTDSSTPAEHIEGVLDILCWIRCSIWCFHGCFCILC